MGDYPLQTEFKGPKSIYTDLVFAKLKSQLELDSSSLLHGPGDGLLTLRCVETPRQDLYMGLEQVQQISAPLERVQAVMDDIDHYKDIFPEFARTEVISRDHNLWLTGWEQHVPVFFVPNVRYEVDYLVGSPSPNQRVYRYQLHKSEDLIASDGFIVLSAIDAQHTAYFELDFYDAHWGLGGVLGKGKLWRENVRGLALSDIGAKLKAENPTWDRKQVLKASENWLEEKKIDVECGKKISAPDYFKK